MPACPKCSQETSTAKPFCVNCGTKLPPGFGSAPAQSVGKVICANCGASTSAAKKFCTACGKPTDKVAAPAAAPVKPPQSANYLRPAIGAAVVVAALGVYFLLPRGGAGSSSSPQALSTAQKALREAQGAPPAFSIMQGVDDRGTPTRMETWTYPSTGAEVSFVNGKYVQTAEVSNVRETGAAPISPEALPQNATPEEVSAVVGERPQATYQPPEDIAPDTKFEYYGRGVVAAYTGGRLTMAAAASSRGPRAAANRSPAGSTSFHLSDFSLDGVMPLQTVRAEPFTVGSLFMVSAVTSMVLKVWFEILNHSNEMELKKSVREITDAQERILDRLIDARRAAGRTEGLKELESLKAHISHGEEHFVDHIRKHGRGELNLSLGLGVPSTGVEIGHTAHALHAVVRHGAADVGLPAVSLGIFVVEQAIERLLADPKLSTGDFFQSQFAVIVSELRNPDELRAMATGLLIAQIKTACKGKYGVDVNFCVQDTARRLLDRFPKDSPARKALAEAWCAVLQSNTSGCGKDPLSNSEWKYRLSSSGGGRIDFTRVSPAQFEFPANFNFDNPVTAAGIPLYPNVSGNLQAGLYRDPPLEGFYNGKELRARIRDSKNLTATMVLVFTGPGGFQGTLQYSPPHAEAGVGGPISGERK